MLEKIKETAVSIGPIALIVLLLSFTVVPMSWGLRVSFMLCSVLTIFGLALFLLGIDIGILPMGERVGSALVSKRNLPFLIIASFVIGFIITIAEPGVHVFTTQVVSVDPRINATTLMFMIAGGIGFFISLGFVRAVFQIPIRIFYIIFYVIAFVLAFLAPSEFFAIAFDASGASTGPLTVPFIIALGIGVASVRTSTADSKADNFGLTGLAAIGPILAVLIMGMLMTGGESNVSEVTVAVSESEIASTVATGSFAMEINKVIQMLPDTFMDVVKAFLPLIGMFIVFLIFLFKMTLRQVIKISIGMIYAFLGLYLFLVGINGGFIPAGTIIGETLGNGNYKALLVILSLTFGAIVVLAEPAVWVLTKQVEEISGGLIRRKVLLVALSAGISIGVGLAMVRVIFGFSIAYILVPFFAVALSLTFFCPKLFTAIAFDSGSVSSGPMTTSFILSFALGASNALGGNPLVDAFGVIGLVAAAPLVAIQILGLIFAKKSAKQGKEK